MVDLVVSTASGKHSVGVLYGGEAQLQGVRVWASWGGRSTRPLDKLENNALFSATTQVYAIPQVLTKVE